MAGRKNSKLLHLAREEAAKASVGVRLNINPVDALQEILDRAVSILRHAAAEADKLTVDQMYVDTAFGPMPHQWIRLEADMRKEVGQIAHGMVRAEIADRFVKVQEAKAALLAQAIMAAAAEVGIPRQKVRELGPALRRHLLLLEGGGEGVDQEGKAA